MKGLENLPFSVEENSNNLKYKKGAKMIQKIIISKNLAWLLILIGGICEVAWVSGLKYADTLPLKALTCLGIAFSFTCAVLAMKRLEVSIVYSVFVGIGTGGVVVAEIVLFGEEASLIKIALISTLMLGVLGLKWSVKESKTAQDIHDHLPEELESLFIESSDTQDFQHNIKQDSKNGSKKAESRASNTDSTKDK
ncbi:multidrug efflux SMR transporter [Helicobacter bilis]|uniref:DMT family transporter n=2 Tax=Helicobacter bilis TaxID=37372 RepID=UPI0026EFF11E|nr:multidrug efflux SMR transporter [Helicobacter bilis]MCI7410197.1 multidrug efflux SMR transporter [Helicobacter bilis]MDY4400795.1 multidrug efflux SMR transporter [Helicobacter bilis]